MHAEHKDNKIIIYDSFAHKETIKQIPGRFWDIESKTWSIPCTAVNLTTLQMIGCTFDDELAERVKEANFKTRVRDGPIVPIEPMPIKASPYAHQIEGYNLACGALGIFSGGGAY